MAIAISNYNKNIISITNLDNSNPILYNISVLNDEGNFVPALNQPSTPITNLAAGATIDIDLINDSIYLLTIAGSPNTLYYFLLDNSLKVCGKSIMEDILCNTCETHSECDKITHIAKVEQLIKYNAIRSNLYYIYNEFVQTQSITDFLVPENGKLLYLSDLVKKLSLICSNCQEPSPCMNVYDSSGNSTGGCGCH